MSAVSSVVFLSCVCFSPSVPLSHCVPRAPVCKPSFCHGARFVPSRSSSSTSQPALVQETRASAQISPSTRSCALPPLPPLLRVHSRPQRSWLAPISPWLPGHVPPFPPPVVSEKQQAATVDRLVPLRAGSAPGPFPSESGHENEWRVARTECARVSGVRDASGLPVYILSFSKALLYIRSDVLEK